MAASPPRRTTPTRKTAAAAAPASYVVHIAYRDESGELQRLPLRIDDQGFYADVQRWRYVVANRQRITRATRDGLSRELADWLRQRCLVTDAAAFERQLRAMARAARLEVQIPFEHESRGYAARLFPWESVLTLMTRPLREAADSQSVLRYLEPVGKAVPRRAGPPASGLVVRSAPGELAGLYDLERECRLLQETLAPQLPAGALLQLNEPDQALLREQLVKRPPALLHLAGVDPYALQSQGLQQAEPDNGDGFVLRRAERGFDAVRPEAMAKLACAGRSKPLLVAVSSCFSAQRLCALAVAEGAQHAIGFVDTLTDADAMLFFGSFYREWAIDWDLPRAFDVARRTWSSQSPTPNAGVVLWSRVSLLEELPAPRRAPEPPREQVTPAQLKLVVDLKRDRGWGGQRTQRTSLNYSLLHNDRSPFSSFMVHKPLPGPLPPLEIEVALEVGSETCRCRFAEELPEGAADIELAPRIRLPLVAGLLRQCTESLRTNLYVKVRCGDRLLRESSERVTVLPADEWRDDGEDHRWLPSFVLPRDPAVLKVIAAAQRYLRTLLDDCTAGFDGYQQLDADDRNAAAVVDAQVQAIWAALQQELPVNYINPPPSYTSQAQRLRSPSEVFRGQAATCIDLALLFASCLEFVGIYPVLFLVEGHAFPGYWRSDKAWWGMKQFHFEPPPANEPAAQQAGPGGGQSESWMFDGRDNLAELLRYVQSGMLVPFESTFVALQRGFFASLEEGAARLHPQSFDAMVDIQSARGANVTPLPLFDKFS